MAGILDETTLDQFTPGLVYDLEPYLALQLIALGGAKEEGSKGSRRVKRTDADAIDEGG